MIATQKKTKPKKSGNGTKKKNNAVKATANAPQTGLLVLVAMVLVVSILAGLRLEHKVRMFVAGEIATHDVTAYQDLLLEDNESTRSKRAQVMAKQPPVFDLSTLPADELEENIQSIFNEINEQWEDDPEKARWGVSEVLNREVAPLTAKIWHTKDFQNLVLGPLFPWIKDFLRDGVVADKRVVLSYKSGIILRDLNTGEEKLVTNVRDIRDFKDFHDSLELLMRRELKKNLFARKAVFTLVEPLLAPTMTLNREATQQRKQEVAAGVDPVYYHIKNGEIIVRKGEQVSAAQQVKLQALYSQRPDYFDPLKASGVFLLGLLFVFGLYTSESHKNRIPSTRDGALLATVVLQFAVLAKVLDMLKTPLSGAELSYPMHADMLGFLMPVAGAAGVLALFLPARVCLFSSLLLSFACSFLLGGGKTLFIYYFLGAMFYTFFVKRSQTRQELLTSIFPLFGAMALNWAGISMLEYQDLAWLGEGAVAAFMNVVLSLLTLLSLGAILETVFGYTSRFKLLELMNLEQPLLQQLMVNAPGTYHHSLVVSNMVEAASKAIGANAILAKVGALYHDIGKLESPSYFIENQFGQANKHDKLAPSMSALILISHVKKGVKLASENRLGPEITDIIRQHHGTSLISFFYKKALEQAEAKGEEAVREEEYRYPGPKPQTKEAGLIMLADAIEASSRTLVDPTHSRVKTHIDTLIRKIFTEGQLDESELTLKDLHLASEAFQRILTGMFHQRIEYPEMRTNDEKLDKTKADKAGESRNLPAKNAPSPLKAVK